MERVCRASPMVKMAAVSKPNLDEGRRGGVSPRPKARGP